MNQLIVLCDKNWIIDKKLYDTSDLGMRVGDCLKDFVLNSEKLERTEDLQAQKQNLVVLTLFGHEQSVPAVIHTYEKHFMVCIAHIESQHDFAEFLHACVNAYTWADDNIKEPYSDEYSAIEQMNNRLVNSERALMKSNMQLKRTLHAINEANDTIALLERDLRTELYSTSGFFRHMCRLRQEQPEAQFDMIVLDIPNFRLLNELFGRDESLRFLQSLALELLGIAGSEQGVLARVYAATFYIFMPHELEFYNKIKEMLYSFLEGYPLPLTLESRIGVYVMKDNALADEEVCNRARLALDYTPTQDENEISFYNDNLHDQLLEEHQLLDMIPEALKNGELQLYLQSKTDMQTNTVVGAEALVRWIHPELGFIAPDRFIPLLEREDMIYDVDKFIWEEACKILEERQKRALEMLPISVNVARNDLYEPTLVQDLQAMVKRHGLEPKNLRLEILERAYVKNSRKSYQILSQLRALGFVIEMDDFGIEESSLSMLAEMPFDILKLDRHFLVRALSNKRYVEVMRFIIQMGHSLQIEIIAEGVENEEHASLLLSLGCRYAQGYFYCKPQPAAFFLEIK